MQHKEEKATLKTLILELPGVASVDGLRGSTRFEFTLYVA